MITRRTFAAALGASLLAAPLGVRAQDRVWRIGFLGAASAAGYVKETDAIRAGLRNLGYVEGKNIVIEYRWAENDPDRLKELAAELVALKPDAIITHAIPATRILAQATSTIPVIMADGQDPAVAGLVASLSRPGGNITGFSAYDSEMGGKWMELLKGMAPGVTRAALLFNPRTAPGGGTKLIWPHLESAARTMLVEPISMPVANAADIERSLRSLGTRPGAGLVVMPDGFMFLNSALVVDLANAMRIPAIYPFRHYATIGGLMTYGVDGADLNLRAASYVDRILKGEKPSDLPVQAPTKYETVVNLKTARALGLTVPAALEVGADEIVE